MVVKKKKTATAATKPKASTKKKGSSAAADDDSDPFAAALKGKDKSFNKARKTKAGGFDSDKLLEALKLDKKGNPKGNKKVRVVAKCTKSIADADDNGNGRVRHTFNIVRGPAEGQMCSVTRTVKDYFKKDDDGEETDEVSYSEEQVMENICQDFQILIDAETEDVTKEDVKEMAATTTKEKPVVSLELKRSGDYLNVKLVKKVEDGEDEEESDDEEEETDEEESEEEEESEDEEETEEEESEDEDEGEDETPEKGNEVTYKKKNYLVFKVYPKGKKVDLASKETKKVVHKGVDWADFKFVYDDEEEEDEE